MFKVTLTHIEGNGVYVYDNVRCIEAGAAKHTVVLTGNTGSRTVSTINYDIEVEVIHDHGSRVAYTVTEGNYNWLTCSTREEVRKFLESQPDVDGIVVNVWVGEPYHQGSHIAVAYTARWWLKVHSKPEPNDPCPRCEGGPVVSLNEDQDGCFDCGYTWGV